MICAASSTSRVASISNTSHGMHGNTLRVMSRLSSQSHPCQQRVHDHGWTPVRIWTYIKVIKEKYLTKRYSALGRVHCDLSHRRNRREALEWMAWPGKEAECPPPDQLDLDGSLAFKFAHLISEMGHAPRRPMSLARPMPTASTPQLCGSTRQVPIGRGEREMEVRWQL